MSAVGILYWYACAKYHSKRMIVADTLVAKYQCGFQSDTIDAGCGVLDHQVRGLFALLEGMEPFLNFASGDVTPA